MSRSEATFGPAGSCLHEKREHHCFLHLWQEIALCFYKTADINLSKNKNCTYKSFILFSNTETKTKGKSTNVINISTIFRQYTRAIVKKELMISYKKFGFYRKYNKNLPYKMT